LIQSVAFVLVFLLMLFSSSTWSNEDTPPTEPPYPDTVKEKNEKIDLGATQKNREVKVLKSWTPPSHEGPLIEGTPFRGTKKIQHPFAKDGLYRITKEGEYIYTVKPSSIKHSSSVRLGTFFPNNLFNPDHPNITYDDVYTETDGVILLADYEWRLFSGFGKLGIKAGSGIFFASGQGRFDNGDEAQERYTIIMFPNSLSAVLYLQFWDKQPLIPYADAGLDLYTFNESRDDNEPPLGRFGAAYAGHVAGGVLFNIGIFDWKGLIRLDQEYGINNVYFAAEYRLVKTLGGTFDFSSDYFNVGVMVEF